MALYPPSFIDDLRNQADIVLVVQDYVSLKKAGVNFKGLCPFHSEKTPSFTVNREKAFYHCFGCGASGNVFTFLQQQEGVGFADAVRRVAERFGVTLPASDAKEGDERTLAEREALLKMHEVAAAFFQERFESPAGVGARTYLRDRGISVDTARRLAIGFAPGGRDGVRGRLATQGFDQELMIRSGLVIRREDGQLVDRFWDRLMFPIARDSGSVIAFGGRALAPDRNPKYLNSPETPIYSKGRTLYGLNLSKQAIKKSGFAVIVEGYFDYAQVYQGGMESVVASCGTALTSAQAYLLKRFASKTVLSFDPDAAGQGAAVRSSELLVGEGFQVNVAVLPAGQDPDTFVRTQGRDAYQQLLRTSTPYLEYLIEQTAANHDLGRDDGRQAFLTQMLTFAARIPEAAARDQFADRVAHRARITEEVVRAEIRKAAVARHPSAPAAASPAASGRPLKQAERGLIWALVHRPAEAVAALLELDPDDLRPLASGSILLAARELRDQIDSLPSALFERLNEYDIRVITGVAAEPQQPAPAGECARAVRRLRYERERAEIQREIVRLQEVGGSGHEAQIMVLSQRKLAIVHRIEEMN